MNKTEKAIVEAYQKSEYYGLYDCYAKPSIAKLDIQMSIIEEMRWHKGFDFRILSFNTFMFTCAYRIDRDDKPTDILVYHSPAKRLIIEIPKI